jgi:predicted PurR-regulated permease PerM
MNVPGVWKAARLTMIGVAIVVTPPFVWAIAFFGGWHALAIGALVAMNGRRLRRSIHTPLLGSLGERLHDG